jgi:hypothetical protein
VPDTSFTLALLQSFTGGTSEQLVSTVTQSASGSLHTALFTEVGALSQFSSLLYCAASTAERPITDTAQINNEIKDL